MRDIGRFAEHLGDLLLQRHHRVEGDVLARLGRHLRAGRYPPAGRSPWRSRRTARRGRDRAEEDQQASAAWPRRHKSSARRIAVEHAIEAALEHACRRCRRIAALRAGSMRAHSIGVSVSDTNAEARIAIVTTTANSLKMRPTTPPISSTGMNTATSEIVIEMMVKPISRAALERRLEGLASSSSMWRTMFSSMTMASSTTRPTDSVSASSEMLSMREAEQIHRAERGDQRDRHRQRRDERRRQPPQEQEDHQDRPARWSGAA